MSIVGKSLDKGSQILSFFRYSRTPFSLTLDSLKLKRTPFVAVSSDRLKLSLQPGSGDSFTFYENLIKRTYMQNGITLRAGSVVVDIGANIGAFAVFAGAKVGPQGRVIAFEPIASTFERLQRNVELNSLNNVECHRAAIDSREGTLVLKSRSKSAYATAYSVNADGGAYREEKAPSLTLDRVLKDFSIDRISLLKVDCEGSEHGIFETLSPQVARRIDQIAMEVHDIEGASIERLGDRLTTLGFTVLRRGTTWAASR